jgi:hypothetical protein
MEARFSHAVEAFESLDEACRVPSLHPFYVVSDAQRDQDLRPVFFIYEGGGETYYHGFHVAEVKGTGFSDIQSPYGYGGPIASSENVEFLAGAWEAYSDWCRQNSILVEFIRFHPLLENWRYHGGEVIDDRQTVWVDLGVGDLLMTYSIRVRTAVRKAIKEGLRVEWVDANRFTEIFPEMYRTTMAQINADDFYVFNDDYFERLLRWDMVHLAVCFKENEALGGAIFFAGKVHMEYHLSASTPVGKQLAATNLILHEAALLGQRLGCRFLHLGGGTDSREDNPLQFFKAGFSSHRGMFKIGKQVHQHEAYAALKDEWLENHGTVSNRILFYRT